MATYVIGDLQGCYQPLMQLLEQIQFSDRDHLYFTGDLVNRGPQSLETLRFIVELGDRAHSVLGNHDITLLAVAYGAIPYQEPKHTFSDILQAPDRDLLLDWVKACPLLLETQGHCIVHAGIYPFWDYALAKTLAKEVEAIFSKPDLKNSLKDLYGKEPNRWDPTLSGSDRHRFITNCFTRMRFCSPQGDLDLNHTGKTAPQGAQPWFTYYKPTIPTLFGHWSALEGECTTPLVTALDTGCVWGGSLTALRLEDGSLFSTSCPRS